MRSVGSLAPAPLGTERTGREMSPKSMLALGRSGLVNRIIAWADGLQREHGVLGFPDAVVKKYGDDAGGRQTALITYYGFLSIFPLLLLGVAVLSRSIVRPEASDRRMCPMFTFCNSHGSARL
jgi:hypothetical protein